MNENHHPLVPLARPSLDANEEQAVARVLRSGWISQGPVVEQFENALAAFLRCRHVVAVNSGTSALTLALKAIGVGPDCSVIVPAFTCPATVLPILALGARPVFVDINLNTLNLTWTDVQPALRPDTKAVLLVHLFGRIADAARFSHECRARRIALIEDAALALGAKQNGQAAGTFGNAGCFSFHPRKMITTGEGGAVCSDDPELARQIATDRNYGAAVSAWERFQVDSGHLQGFERLAFNMKLTDLQAALGVCQLEKLPGFIARRRAIVQAYRDGLANLPTLRLLAPANQGEEDVHQAFVCLWEHPNADDLIHDSRVQGITERFISHFREKVTSQGVAISDAAQFLPELPIFRPFAPDDDPRLRFPHAYLASRLAFALPIFPEMPYEAVRRVVATVIQAARRTSCSTTAP